MGSHFAQNTTPNPYSLLSRHTPLSAIVRTQNTPKPTPKHPFSWPELESGQNELPSGQFGPQLGKCLKSGQNVSRSGQKHFIILFLKASSSIYLEHVCPLQSRRTVRFRNSIDCHYLPLKRLCRDSRDGSVWNLMDVALFKTLPHRAGITAG